MPEKYLAFPSARDCDQILNEGQSCNWTKQMTEASAANDSSKPTPTSQSGVNIDWL